MKKNIFRILIILCFTIFLTGCKKNYIEEISYDEYLKLIENNETFALEIMRTSCSACEYFKDTLNEFANEYKINIKVINTDNLSKEDKIKFSNDTGVESTPTIIFYKNGKETSVATRIVGSVSKNKLIDKFKDNGYNLN